jgi:membrane protein implicated in regulation of membrane protease activity
MGTIVAVLVIIGLIVFGRFFLRIFGSLTMAFIGLVVFAIILIMSWAVITNSHNNDPQTPDPSPHRAR